MTAETTSPRHLSAIEDAARRGMRQALEDYDRTRRQLDPRVIDAPYACSTRRVGEPRWDSREIARSALGDLPERERAEFLTELLCELSGSDAAALLSIARRDITAHLHVLIGQDIDQCEAAR